MGNRTEVALSCILSLAVAGACGRPADDPLRDVNYPALAEACVAKTPGTSSAIPGHSSWSGDFASRNGDHWDRETYARRWFSADAATVPSVLSCVAGAVAREVAIHGFSVDQVQIERAAAGVDFHRGPRHGRVELLCLEAAGESSGAISTPPHFSLALTAVAR